MSSKQSQKKLYRDIDIQVLKNLDNIKIFISNISKELESYFNKLKEYIENSKRTSEYLNKIIDKCINFIKDQNDPKCKGNIKIRKENLDMIKKLSESYDKNLFEIYENEYLKKIEKYNQDLNEIITEKLFDPDFEPPNINSFINDEFQPKINSISQSSENNSNVGIIGYNSFLESKNTNDSLNFKDKLNNIKNSCQCTSCKKKGIINFCEECNNFFCESCFNSIKKTHKHKSIFFLDRLENELEQKRVLFINSIEYVIKNILIKSNELLNSEYMKINYSSNSLENNFNNDSQSNNSSKIQYIKRILFNYPYIENYNDNSELEFLKKINKIIINDLNKKDINTESFYISEMHDIILKSIVKIFVDEKFNILTQIIEKIENDFASDDENDGDGKENYVKKNIDFQIDEKEYSDKKNLFYYVIYILPQRRFIFHKKNFQTIFIKQIKDLLHIDENNIFVSFDNKKTFINTFIKTNEFIDLSLQNIKKNYPNFEKLYEYKIIYENILNNKKYLDVQGNTIYYNSNDNLIRGTEKYYPPYEWYGIGLKVIGKYDNDDWLDINSREWTIAYYSISQILSSNQIKEILNKVVIKNEFPNDNNIIKSSSKDKRHKNKKVGNGIYLYQDIKMAERFTGKILINNKRYKVVLMAKVLIEKIREPEDINFWILDKKYIRFYRILVKEFI